MIEAMDVVAPVVMLVVPIIVRHQSPTQRIESDRALLARLSRMNQAIPAAVPVLLPIAPHKPLHAEGLGMLAARLEEVVVDLRARANEVDQVIDAVPEPV
jgi:hypothetical protein